MEVSRGGHRLLSLLRIVHFPASLKLSRPSRFVQAVSKVLGKMWALLALGRCPRTFETDFSCSGDHCMFPANFLTCPEAARRQDSLHFLENNLHCLVELPEYDQFSEIWI